jgi:hypothetical protein
MPEQTPGQPDNCIYGYANRHANIAECAMRQSENYGDAFGIVVYGRNQVSKKNRSLVADVPNFFRRILAVLCY